METPDDLSDDFEFSVAGRRYGPALELIKTSEPGPVRAWYAHDHCQICDTPGGPLHNHHVHNVAQHSSKSQEHYLPPEYAEAVRGVLGVIDLDPASSECANSIVGATHWYGVDEDGLSKPWHGGVYLNPPGGLTIKARPDLSHVHASYPMIWWAKLLAEYTAGRVTEAIFAAFKLEMLAQSQTPIVEGMPSMLDFPVCIPRKRVAWYYPSDTRLGRPVSGAQPVRSKQPTHGAAFVYLPPVMQPARQEQVEAFQRAFAQFGHVIVP